MCWRGALPGPEEPPGGWREKSPLKEAEGLPSAVIMGAAGKRGLAEAGGLSDAVLQQMAPAVPSFSLEGCRRLRHARAALQSCQEALPGPAAVLVLLSHAQEAASPRPQPARVGLDSASCLHRCGYRLGPRDSPGLPQFTQQALQEPGT